MIWNFIRDFLVQNVFGGTDSNLDYYRGFIGVITDAENYPAYSADTVDYCVPIGPYLDMGYDYANSEGYISLGDWLSTTCTIIIMVAIVILFALLVRWVYRAVTSAFLLR